MDEQRLIAALEHLQAALWHCAQARADDRTVSTQLQTIRETVAAAHAANTLGDAAAVTRHLSQILDTAEAFAKGETDARESYSATTRAVAAMSQCLTGDTAPATSLRTAQ